MTHRRYRNTSKPTPRNMTVKFAGKCHCCGAEIKAGEWATYYPPGTCGNTKGVIAHCGGLDGTGVRCPVELQKRWEDDYAGNGLDARYEDQCHDICGP